MAASYLGLLIIVWAFEYWELLAIPKTNDPELQTFAKDRGLDKGKWARTCKQRRAQMLDFLLSPQMLAALLLLGAAVGEAIALKGSDKQIGAIVAAGSGAAITALSVLTWAKIQQTFMRYLYLMNKYRTVASAGA